MSEIVELTRGERIFELKPGQWAPTVGDAPVVWVSCGGCGAKATLEDHSIAPDGTVNPSLVCPEGCGWHVFGRLVGWPV